MDAAAQPQATKKCPFCAETVLAEATKCRFCGQWLSQPQTSAVIEASQVQPPLGPHQLYMVYDSSFDINRMAPTQRELYKKHTLSKTFPAAGAIALHYITIGVFTMIFYGLKHSRLPKIHPDDFTAGRAIGFLFIPFFNFYWLFQFWLRLTDRVNFQFRLRHQPPPVSRGLVLTATIIQIIPYVGFVWWLVMGPLVISQMQGALNNLAAEAQPAFVAHF